HHVADLVALKVANEVPHGVRPGARGGLSLGYEFLRAVLAEVLQPRVQRLAHELGRVRLGDGDEADLRGIAVAALTGAGDAVAYERQAVSDRRPGRRRRDVVSGHAYRVRERPCTRRCTAAP